MKGWNSETVLKPYLVMVTKKTGTLQSVGSNW